MITCAVDESGRLVTMSYYDHVGISEVKDCLQTMREFQNRLQPGFILLADLGGLQVMDPDCASDLGTLMEFCNAQGMSSVLRVIPDPMKDIGFGLISKFHLSSQVHVQTYPSLAEAIASLLRN